MTYSSSTSSASASASPSSSQASASSSSVTSGSPNSPTSASQKPWFWALLFVMLFLFILMLFLYIFYRRRKLSKQCFVGICCFPFNFSIRKKYDVFLSFRGDDTRNNFISHLYAKLKKKDVRAFIDNNLVRGEDIASSLFKTIEDSKISIVILSKDYASSKWCLRELVKIMDCRKTNMQFVIPVFYLVDPSDVRHVTGSFGEAIEKHEQSSTVKRVEVEKWKAALKEVAKLSGWHSSGNESESELVEKITEDTLKKLTQKPSSHNSRVITFDNIESQV